MNRPLALVFDNPIIVKDGVLPLRQRRTLLGLGFAAVAVAVVAALTWLDETSARQWAPDGPVGDGLMLGMLSLSFFAAGVLLTATASSTLSGEREHGTLPLLTVTGLSPSRIVIGKTAAMLVLAAPFVALPLPAAVFGAVSAGVSLWWLAVTLVGLAVSMVAFAAVGVYASSLTARSRTSAPAALLAAGVPALFCALPAMVLIASATQTRGVGPAELQTAVAGLVGGAVITLAALYGAWSNIASRGAGRFAPASALFGLVAVGLPLVATGLSRFPWDVFAQGRWRQTPEEAPLFCAFFFVAAAVMLFSAGVGRDRSAPAPWKVVPSVVLLATIGYVGALLLASNPVAGMQPDSALSARDEGWSLIVVLWLHLVAAASLASLASRFVGQPLLAACIGVAATLVLVLVPAIADGLTVGPTPMAFLNFVYAREEGAVTAALTFWTALSVGALALTRRPSSGR